MLQQQNIKYKLEEKKTKRNNNIASVILINI